VCSWADDVECRDAPQYYSLNQDREYAFSVLENLDTKDQEESLKVSDAQFYSRSARQISSDDYGNQQGQSGYQSDAAGWSPSDPGVKYYPATSQDPWTMDRSVVDFAQSPVFFSSSL
jgi:hypothetical protein